MRRLTTIVLAGMMLTATQAYASGNLIVDGKLGVGTASPSNKLHVNGGITWGGIIAPFSFSGIDATGLYIEQTGNNDQTSEMRLQSSVNGGGTDYSQFFINPSHGFSFMTIGAGNGNVGIGTMTPGAKFEVSYASGADATFNEHIRTTGQYSGPHFQDNSLRWCLQ